MYNVEDIADEINAIDGYDISFEPIYFNSWSSYEDHGWIVIAIKDGSLYSLEGGYSVMCSKKDNDKIIITALYDEEAMDIMEEWDNNYG